MAYEVRRNLELLLEHLRPSADIGWVPSANFHVTTKFIGEWAEGRLPELVEALRSMPASGPFQFAVRGLGWLPNPHQPRLLLAGVAGDALSELARLTGERLADLGVAAETRPLQPHLTLARIKGTADLAALRRAIAGLPSTDFGGSLAKKFQLYRSRRSDAGSEYTVVAEIAL